MTFPFGVGGFLAVIPESMRCQAVTRAGNRCRNVAMTGTTECRSHGGYRLLGFVPEHVKLGRAAKAQGARLLRAAGQEWVLGLKVFQCASGKDRLALGLVAGDEGQLRLEVAALRAKLKARGWNV
jgi:hypothetical protein